MMKIAIGRDDSFFVRVFKKNRFFDKAVKIADIIKITQTDFY